MKILKNSLFFQLFIIFFCINYVYSIYSHVDQVEFKKRIAEKNLLVKFFAPWCGHCQKFEPEYKKISETLENIENLDVVAVNCEDHRQFAGEMEITSLPTIRFYKKGDIKNHIPYEGDRNHDSIVEFVKTNLQHPIKRKEDSNKEPVTKVESKSKVVALSDSSFTNIVNAPNLNVLVKFYAPWCGHCKNMAPTYEKLAKIFSNDPNVIIAKVDCTEQKVVAADEDIRGYPTLKFYPAMTNSEGKVKKPISYNGARDISSLVEFVNSNSGTFRDIDGSLKENAGAVKEFDDYILEFFNHNDKALYASKLFPEKAGDLLQKFPSTKHYVTTMTLIAKRGDEFLQSEIVRLNKIISNAQSNLSAAKLDELKTRLNILKHFEKISKGTAQKEEL